MTTQWGAPLTGAQMKLLRAAGLPDGTEYQTVTWGGVWHGCQIGGCIDLPDDAEFRLPIDHAAYTLLNAGWLDGRNVALWFGGESWPNSWLEGSDIIRRDGTVEGGDHLECWRHNGDERDIIAYIRKAEGMTTHADRVLADAERMARRMGGELGQNELWGDVVASSEECPACEPTPCYCDVMAQDPNAPQNEYPPANEKLKEAVRLSREMTAQPETVTIAKMTEADAMKQWGTMVNGDNFILELRRLGLIKEPTRLERFWQAQPNGGAHVTNDVKAWVLAALYFEREK